MYSEILKQRSPQCKHNGRGCHKEDSCYLSDLSAGVSCGLYLYFNFLDEFNDTGFIETEEEDLNFPENMFDTYEGPGLSQCHGVKRADKMGCPDLLPSGKCLNQQRFCPLMEYKAF